ncbi:uncharacterized protein RCC_07759 [Lecanosticta acicola]|uniref:Pre-rRNA-processing protein RIX1 n=1 Tax=Lecanosticta acicola TaxID=111012 RepID=A0AAI8Z7V5_9PEZI|nr:uncharacterized protein RCC_07759 [Lecanosticta acicola]
MAQQTAASVGQLRALIFRLTSTPPKQLPGVAAQIAGSIWSCRDLLSSPSDAKQAGDASTTVHRFKTQLSTLLQDRTVEGRWAAIVLLKATIEAGGSEVLAKSNPWVRNLLGILKKPDPPTTRNLAVITLTRIFVLTWDHSNLVREITTPALTAFVPTCLANLENKRCSTSEFQNILEAFATLLPRHPTIFRTNESKLRSILTRVLSATTSDPNTSFHYTEAQRDAAHRVYVLLHHCTPKQGASEKWDATLRSVVHATHSTCDRIFRAVQEHWQSGAGIESSVPAHLRASGNVESESADAAGFGPWKGIHAGAERTVSLLGLLQSHLATATTSNVSIRVGLVSDLLSRLFAISAPSSGKQENVKLNNQITKDEREALFADLPKIHVAAIQLASTMLKRLRRAASSWTQNLFDQAIALFISGGTHVDVRKNLYQLLALIIDRIGPSLSRDEVAELDQAVKSCCEEILPKVDMAAHTTSKSNGTASGVKQNLGLVDSGMSSTHPADFSDVQEVARELLRTFLERVDSACIPPKLRANIDRTAVLSNEKALVLASIMNPPKKSQDARVRASLLPILARQFGRDPEAEALLRPRMPPIFTRTNGRRENEVDEPESRADGQDVMDVEEGAAAAPGMLDMLIGASESNLDEQDATPADSIEAEEDRISSSKRRADEDAVTTPPAKRIRASPIAESLMPDSMQTLPGPDPATHHSAIPETVVGEAQSQPAAAAQESVVITGEGSAEDINDDDDDDSDMELPPLTMEPDTDPEGEDEEE